MSNPSVLRGYIDRELTNTSPTLPNDDREKLATIAEGFLKNEISYNMAVNVFAECSIPSSLITKLAHIKAVGENPLPIPNKELIRPAPPKPTMTRKKAVVWSQEEDFRLLTAVSRYGNHDWRMISAFVGSGRTSSQCNQRWTRALNPQINHNPWTDDEDRRLVELVGEMGSCKWRKIAERLHGRTDLQCRHRYLQLRKRPDIEEPRRAETPVIDIPYLLNKRDSEQDPRLIMPPLILRKV